MENKEMEGIKIKKEKMEKIIKEVEREFPNDFALQEVHIARRVLEEEAKEKGMDVVDYIKYLRNVKKKDEMQGKDNERDNEQ